MKRLLMTGLILAMVLPLVFVLAGCNRGDNGYKPGNQIAVVEGLIADLAPVTNLTGSTTDRGRVANAREAFDALTVTQRANVGNVAILEQAELRIIAVDVEELISGLDPVNTLVRENRDCIRAARSAYFRIHQSARSFVNNTTILEQAEAHLHALDATERTVTIVQLQKDGIWVADITNNLIVEGNRISRELMGFVVCLEVFYRDGELYIPDIDFQIDLVILDYFSENVNALVPGGEGVTKRSQIAEIVNEWKFSFDDGTIVFEGREEKDGGLVVRKFRFQYPVLYDGSWEGWVDTEANAFVIGDPYTGVDLDDFLKLLSSIEVSAKVSDGDTITVSVYENESSLGNIVLGFTLVDDVFTSTVTLPNLIITSQIGTMQVSFENGELVITFTQTFSRFGFIAMMELDSQQADEIPFGFEVVVTRTARLTFSD